MNKLLAAFFILALAGCGGGGSSATPATQPLATAPTAAPAPAATPAPGTGNLSTATLLGSLGFVNKTTSATTYVLSADTFATSACNAASGCTGLWPPVKPAAGATLTGGFSSFVRSDGTTQLAFNGNPLYTYSGDSAAGQTNGNGINSFGGIWTVGRPTLANAPPSAADPAPTPTPFGGAFY